MSGTIYPCLPSAFIVYVDESGDHSLESIDSQYPIFCLSFCCFNKDAYARKVTPQIRILKFETWGHDMFIFHESEIRKKRGPFSKMGKSAREVFMHRLSTIIEESEFLLFSIVIDKRKLITKYSKPTHPYYLAMEFGLERLFRFLKQQNQDDRVTYLIFESRGAKEDKELELQFRRVRDGENYFRKYLPFEIHIADKKTNSEGLQFADLTARPIGLSVLYPDRKNRAMEVLENKFYRDNMGNVSGFGLKVFP